VLRELDEEAGLVGRVAELLWVRDDGGRRASYFRVDDVRGEPRLGGPESVRSSPDNQFALRWASVEDLDDLGLRPAELIPLLVGLLDGTRDER
jgi:8-oxo-dGTP pyrophosphatase MutT (NUDIX family)